MKVWLVFVGLLMCIAAVLGYYSWKTVHPDFVISPVSISGPKPLEKFTIEQLSARTFDISPIVLDDTIATESGFLVYSFHYISDAKRVTGIAHVPADASPTRKKPVILQFRGYVDPDNYSPGVGTRRSAEVFAQNGFISLAPDFLGYGGSDPLSQNIFQDRFETYTTALQLYNSVSTLSVADSTRIGIWGHSNGGHIALTIAEILGKPVPLTLWAPVSKPFPYSILYYTDDADDRGKYLRRELAAFENVYDADKFSMTNYTDRLSGPIHIHQGGRDDAVPQKWTDTFVRSLKDQNRDVSYFLYPDADHDMRGSWSTVIGRDIEFLTKQLKK